MYHYNRYRQMDSTWDRILRIVLRLDNRRQLRSAGGWKRWNKHTRTSKVDTPRLRCANQVVHCASKRFRRPVTSRSFRGGVLF